MPLRWHDLTLTLGNTGRVKCEPGWSIGQEWSRHLRDYDLWLIRAGAGVMHYPGGEVQLRPGVCLWLYPGGDYSATQDEQNRLAVTYIHFDLRDRRGRRPPDVHLPPLVLEAPALDYLDGVTRRIFELRRQNGAGAEDLFRGLLRDLELSASQVRSSGIELHHYRLVMDAAARLAEDATRRLSVEDLAAEAGYSADHFSRLFTQVLGKSPQQYVIAARLQRACELLRESPMSIKEIARAMNYRSVYFFSRQFRAKLGITPTAYRRRS